MEKQVSIKKNAILNIIKQILKIAFPLITFPYVSRILLDENIGKYNFSLSVISYFLLIAGLGVNSYGVREGARIRSNKEQCNKLANEIFSINLLSTIISYVLLFITWVIWKQLRSYTTLLVIQSLTMIFTTLGADWVNGIYEDYEYMTKRYIFVKIISLVLIFLLIHKKEDYILYTEIVVGSEVLANCLNIIYIRRYLKLKLVTKLNIQKHIKPLLILFANTIAITIYLNADITMLGIFKGDSIVGIYSVSSKMYQIAKNLINAIIVVVIPRLSAILGSNDKIGYNKLLEKTLKSIIVFMFPLITGMFMLSKECVLILGGDTFLSGDLAVKLLSLALIPASINSVFFDGVLIVNRKEKFCMVSTIISAAVNILFNFFFIPIYSFYGACITTFISEALGCGLAVFFSRDFHNIHIKFDKDIISVITGCIAIIIICLLTNSIGIFYIKVIAGVFLSFVAYAIILLVMKNSLVINLVMPIRNKFRNK